MDKEKSEKLLNFVLKRTVFIHFPAIEVFSFKWSFIIVIYIVFINNLSIFHHYRILNRKELLLRFSHLLPRLTIIHSG